MRAALPVLALILLSGCGGNSPTIGPSPIPSPPTFTGSVTDTVTGAPIANFTATVAGSSVTIEAAGYVTRQTRVSAPTVDLFPEAGFDLAFYRQFARGALEGHMDELRRWQQNPSIYLQRTGLSDATVAALERAARDVVPALTGGRLSVQAWETGQDKRPARSGWIVVEVYTDPAAECGRATIGGGDIRINTAPVCVDGNYLIVTFAHEIGHTLGFWHVPSGLMAVGGTVTSPSPRERHHAALAYARQPGNRDVDVDSAVSASVQTRIISD